MENPYSLNDKNLDFSIYKLATYFYRKNSIN